MTRPERDPAAPGRFTLSSEARDLARLREWLRAEMAGLGVERETRAALVLAVGELCANSIEHAYEGRGGQPIHVSIEGFEDRLVLEVEDFGRAFDAARYVAPDLDALPDHGLGIHLVHRIADSVSVDTRRTRGTRWTLVKYRPGHGPADRSIADARGCAAGSIRRGHGHRGNSFGRDHGGCPQGRPRHGGRGSDEAGPVRTRERGVRQAAGGSRERELHRQLGHGRPRRHPEARPRRGRRSPPVRAAGRRAGDLRDDPPDQGHHQSTPPGGRRSPRGSDAAPARRRPGPGARRGVGAGRLAEPSPGRRAHLGRLLRGGPRGGRGSGALRRGGARSKRAPPAAARQAARLAPADLREPGRGEHEPSRVRRHRG